MAILLLFRAQTLKISTHSRTASAVSSEPSSPGPGPLDGLPNMGSAASFSPTPSSPPTAPIPARRFGQPVAQPADSAAAGSASRRAASCEAAGAARAAGLTATCSVAAAARTPQPLPQRKRSHCRFFAARQNRNHLSTIPQLSVAE